MPVLFEDLGLCEADGRSVLHLKSDDVASDVAELEYLLTHWARINRSPVEYEVIAEEHSIHLLQKFPALAK